jgi:homoserine dehydrogenase
MSPAPPATLRLALVGFGSVGRRLAELLLGPYRAVAREQGLALSVTGLATAHHGCALDPDGLPLRRALEIVGHGRSLTRLHRAAGPAPASAAELVTAAPADVLVELTPLDPHTGEPATSLCAAALRRGLHVVTTNKGPVAFAARRLQAVAARHGVRFLHEGAVMDGLPVFGLAARCLRGVKLLGFRGVLNATTTRILSRMEAGHSLAAALAEAQAAGVAEADPRHDLDGWDAAVKGCALANALMGADLRPADVPRTGLGRIGPARLARAAAQGRRIRLVTRGRRDGRRVRVTVATEALPLGDPMASQGADGVLILETDLLGEVGLLEGVGGVDQTAYAVLSDLLEVAATAGAS